LALHPPRGTARVAQAANSSGFVAANAANLYNLAEPRAAIERKK
jgi:hypothetical protein